MRHFPVRQQVKNEDAQRVHVNLLIESLLLEDLRRQKVVFIDALLLEKLLCGGRAQGLLCTDQLELGFGLVWFILAAQNVVQVEAAEHERRLHLVHVDEHVQQLENQLANCRLVNIHLFVFYVADACVALLCLVHNDLDTVIFAGVEASDFEEARVRRLNQSLEHHEHRSLLLSVQILVIFHYVSCIGPVVLHEQSESPIRMSLQHLQSSGVTRTNLIRIGWQRCRLFVHECLLRGLLLLSLQTAMPLRGVNALPHIKFLKLK